MEAWAQLQPADFARFTLGYTAAAQGPALRRRAGGPGQHPQPGQRSRQQWSLRAQFDLPRRTEFDFQVRHVGHLPSPLVPAYTVADARLGWQVTPRVEVSLIAQEPVRPAPHRVRPPANASQFGRRIFLRVVCSL